MRCRPKLGPQFDNKAQYRPNSKTETIDTQLVMQIHYLYRFFPYKSSGTLFFIRNGKITAGKELQWPDHFKRFRIKTKNHLGSYIGVCRWKNNIYLMSVAHF